MWKKRRTKKQVDKLITKNMGDTPLQSWEAFIHPTDKGTLSALKKIPLFDKACSKLISTIGEPVYRVRDMSSKIRITDKQLSRVYHMTESICHKIGIEMPTLYLELNRNPNAYTYGTEAFSITMTSGLLECLADDELYAVLAHECGHIACQHVLYHTVGGLLLGGGTIGMSAINDILGSTLLGGLIKAAAETSLQLAFYHWKRCSELSADRIAVYCCRDAAPVIKTMMRLSGGTSHINAEIDMELFLSQAEDYETMLTDKKINKALEFLLVYDETHPLTAVRAYEAQKFAASDEFKEIALKASAASV